MAFERTKFFNSSEVKFGVLSLTICLGSPNLAKMVRRMSMVLLEVEESVPEVVAGHVFHFDDSQLAIVERLENLRSQFCWN